MSDMITAVPKQISRREEGLRRLKHFAGSLHPHEGYLCQHDSDLLASLIHGADASVVPGGSLPGDLRRAYDRLKRVVDGNVGFPECVEASHAFTRTAFEAIGAMLAAEDDANAAPSFKVLPHHHSSLS